MNVVDARRPALRHRQRIGPGKGQVTGVQQQPDLFAGMGHQVVHVVSRLNHRPHMVVIGNLHPLLLSVAGKFRELLAILLPACLREARAQMHRRLLLAVNAAAHLRKYQHLCPQLTQQRQVGLHGGNLLFHAALQQAAGVPARDQLQIVALQNGAKQARFTREFVAQFETGKTGLFPLAQTGLQRRFGTKGRQIVVSPRQGVNA